MSPGGMADKAWMMVSSAGGALGAMVVKKKLTRSGLLDVAARLEEAAKLVRRAASP